MNKNGNILLNIYDFRFEQNSAAFGGWPLGRAIKNSYANKYQPTIYFPFTSIGGVSLNSWWKRASH